MRVLALDPGKTTGAVEFQWDGKAVAPTGDALIDFDQLPFDGIPRRLQSWIQTVDLVVMERFTISQRTLQYSRQPEPLYVIGGVVFLCDLLDVPLRMQSASAAKTAYSDDRIKALGWLVKGRHAKDALRHGLLATHTPWR